ncbi:hypothetical protein J2R76_003707 [Bradyrhizobium sp. USDA 4532]|nr:hypothetical protein [Bradyrhizobium sp. USDA 4545]MCP1920116.1 hypothetical protein [Bradyrhizobium sp. USDA 4532]
MTNDPRIICYGRYDDSKGPQLGLDVVPAKTVRVSREAAGTFTFEFANELQHPPVVILTSTGLAGDGYTQNVFARSTYTKGFTVLGYLNGHLSNTSFRSWYSPGNEESAKVVSIAASSRCSSTPAVRGGGPPFWISKNRCDGCVSPDGARATQLSLNPVNRGAAGGVRAGTATLDPTRSRGGRKQITRVSNEFMHRFRVRHSVQCEYLLAIRSEQFR